MATMTLGEFRKLTSDMEDDAKITIRIDSNGQWIHPSAGYHVSSHNLDYENGPLSAPTGICLNHIATEFSKH